jgi:hypothetical protein
MAPRELGGTPTERIEFEITADGPLILSIGGFLADNSARRPAFVGLGKGG